MFRWILEVLLKSVDVDFELRLIDTHVVEVKVWYQNKVVFDKNIDLLPKLGG